MSEAGPTICLCMIVKNEQHVIRRCLQSVLPLLDSWVIVDTGSTDGTQETVREFLRDVPGELFERPWVSFEHNRSESLALGRGRADYQLIIDADEWLEYDSGFSLPALTADAYDFPMRSGNLNYYKTQLVRAALPWRYVGVVHEYVMCEQARTREPMPGLRTIRVTDGARSRDAMTYRRDALLLEEALLHEPGNTRHMFYLGQSYADAQEPLLAIDRYAKRAAMGGWHEEVWLSLYQVAYLKQKTGASWDEVMEAFLAAYAFRADRAEPLFRLGLHYQEQRSYAVAHLFFARAMEIPYPAADLLYIEREIYDYYLPLEYGVACFYIGRHREAVLAANRMLLSGMLTREQEDKVIANRRFSLDALLPPRTPAQPPAGRVVLCVFFHGDMRVLDSLRAQQDSPAAIVFDTTAGGIGETPAGWTVVSVSADATWGACVAHAARHARPDDLMLLPASGFSLSGDRAATAVAETFARQECRVLYGQFRWDDGRIGDVVPILSPEELYVAASSRLSLLPLACTRSLLDELPLSDDTMPVDLLRASGFPGLRFHDGVLAVRGDGGVA